MRIPTRIVSVTVMLLFGIFAACVSLVLIMGARVYQSVTERDNLTVSVQAVKQYLIMKTRSMDDAANRIYVADFEGTRQSHGGVLSFYESAGGGEYKTLIYCDGTNIRELFADKDIEFEQGMGEIIMEADALEFEETEGGILTAVWIDGIPYQIYLSTQTNRGGLV